MVFFVKGETRRFLLFFALGLLACLFSAYINSFFVAVLANNGYASLTEAQSIVQITPICEELMKALPVFVYVAVFLPGKKDISIVALAAALGFATLENVFYMAQNIENDIVPVILRSFSIGGIHIVCAAILGGGFATFYRRGRLAVPGGFALLCASSTFHAIYNLMVAEGGTWRLAGHIMPVAALLVVCFLHFLYGKTEPY